MRLVVLMLFLSGCNPIVCEDKPTPNGKCVSECFEHGTLTLRSRQHECR